MRHHPRRIAIMAGLASSLINFRGPLVKALCDAGLEVHAFAPELTSDEPTRRRLTEWGVVLHDVPLHRAGVNPLRDFSTLWVYMRKLREIKPDLALGYTIKPVIYGTIGAWLAGVPRRFALITGLGYAFTGQAAGKRKLVQKIARELYRLALKHSELVYFQNPDDEALFRTMGLVPITVSTKVVNGSGIDTAIFEVAPLPQDAPSFLLIARLLGDKGIREYVRAAAVLKLRYPNAQFRLVGDIDPNPDSITRTELDGWIANGAIDYSGWLSDVRPAIADTCVYVLPSYREGTPRTVLEAMAMGRAIITTDAPGCRETVIDGENGFLVPVKSVDALVEAMTRFIEDPDLAVRMGKRSREIAEEKYDVHKVNAVMLKEMGIQ